METVEVMIVRWLLSEGGMNVAVNLRCLAGVAFPGPLPDVAFQVVPHKSCVQWVPKEVC